MADPNIGLLVGIAGALGPLREELVFVGGCATSLLITDAAAAPVRATDDVDAIAAIASLPDYHRLGEALRARGFSQSIESGDPPYRWRYTGMVLDVMPIDEKLLGFSNRWYEGAIRTAKRIALKPGLEIRLVAAAYFIATKLEAFMDRGKGDYLSSHDLEDILSVVDGRPELIAEVAAADEPLRQYVGAAFSRLLRNEGFLNALPGMVFDGSPAERLPRVQERLKALADLA